LIPSLAARRVKQESTLHGGSVGRTPLCMGRRSDKIKNRKDAQTRARTKIFARIGKMIMIAAKSGGSNLVTNKALADALDVARAASFPKETMEKAIARATSTDQADFKESSFEVYGHGGAVCLAVWSLSWNG
jgi:transcriptional/translational regulatory protein YebC/TACO1